MYKKKVRWEKQLRVQFNVGDIVFYINENAEIHRNVIKGVYAVGTQVYYTILIQPGEPDVVTNEKAQRVFTSEEELRNHIEQQFKRININ